MEKSTAAGDKLQFNLYIVTEFGSWLNDFNALWFFSCVCLELCLGSNVHTQALGYQQSQ